MIATDQAFFALQCNANAGTRKKKTITIRTLPKKVQSKRTQFFFVYLKLFAEPGAIGVPQRQGDNPVEQGEKDPNGEGTQEQVSEENDFFAFHDSSVIS